MSSLPDPERFTVADVAKRLGTSENFVMEYIRAGTLKSFFSAVKRIERVKKLLIEGKEDKEVAKEVGYAPGRCLPAAFKRMTGQTLEGFKEEIRDEETSLRRL